MVLDAALLNTQYYKVRIKDKVEQSREWSRALPNTEATERGYWKGSLRVALDYGRQLYLLYLLLERKFIACRSDLLIVWLCFTAS